MAFALAIALFTGVFALMGWGSLLGSVGSAIIYPFQWAVSSIGNGISGFASYFQDIRDLREQVESLEAENESLKSDLVDAEICFDESSWLYQYLAMKEEHSDYKLCGATVIASSSASGGGGAHATEITLNKGSTSGVETGMPVITPSGLVGVVVEVGITHCQVSTILDPSVSVGAVSTRASENGMCEGDHTHLHTGRATLRYLPEEADIEPDDIILTSGRGSVYPYGIPIGRVESVQANAFSRTTEATVIPFVNFSELREVVILTDFIHYIDGYETSGGGS